MQTTEELDRIERALESKWEQEYKEYLESQEDGEDEDYEDEEDEEEEDDEEGIDFCVYWDTEGL